MYIAQVPYCITGISAYKVHEKAAVLHVKADKKGQERGGDTDEGKLTMMTMKSKLTLITKGKLILIKKKRKAVDNDQGEDGEDDRPDESETTPREREETGRASTRGVVFSSQ
jgi:hypothetical protein